MMVAVIAAMAEHNRAIGFEGKLPWRLPAELAIFRQRTMGHTLIMGRKTFATLKGPLPGRKIIILTRRSHLLHDGVRVANSIESALAVAKKRYKESEVFIAGGEQVYAQVLAMNVLERMYLTIVHGTFPADAYFPAYDEAAWEEVSAQTYPADEANAHAFTVRVLHTRDGSDAG